MANLAQLQLLATYLVSYMLLTELYGERQRVLVVWGVILLFVNLGTVVLAIWLQVTESNRQIVVQLMLLEREIRTMKARAVGQRFETRSEHSEYFGRGCATAAITQTAQRGANQLVPAGNTMKDKSRAAKTC